MQIVLQSISLIPPSGLQVSERLEVMLNIESRSLSLNLKSVARVLNRSGQMELLRSPHGRGRGRHGRPRRPPAAWRTFRSTRCEPRRPAWTTPRPPLSGTSRGAELVKSVANRKYRIRSVSAEYLCFCCLAAKFVRSAYKSKPDFTTSRIPPTANLLESSR